MMRNLWRKLMCRIGRHETLDVIQTFGVSQHIGCPHCGREFGINHNVLAIIPWDPSLEAMYRTIGYETRYAGDRWRQSLRARVS